MYILNNIYFKSWKIIAQVISEFKVEEAELYDISKALSKLKIYKKIISHQYNKTLYKIEFQFNLCRCYLTSSGYVVYN